MKKGFDITDFLYKNKLTLKNKGNVGNSVFKGYNDIRRKAINEVKVVDGKLKLGNKLIELNNIELDNSNKPIKKNKIQESNSNNTQFSNELKKHFLEIISTYKSYQNQMDRPSEITEVANTLGAIVEAAKELALNESGDWFDKVTIKRNMTELEKLGQKFEKFAVDARSMDERLHSLYEDMGHILNRYYEISDIDPDTLNKRLGKINESNKKLKFHLFVTNTDTGEDKLVGSFGTEGDGRTAFKMFSKIAPSNLKYKLKKNK